MVVVRRKDVDNSTVLVHHGIKGQRWGIRRFQNEDGSLTNAGKKRYSFKERMEIDKERLDKENSLRNKYLNESKDFQKYAKMADNFENECLKKYGFRPGNDGYIWEYDEESGEEYDREPRNDIEKKAIEKYIEIDNKAGEAAGIPGRQAREEARKYIAEKYGNKVLDQIQRDEAMVIGAATVASLAMAAAPFALVGFGVHGIKKLLD